LFIGTDEARLLLFVVARSSNEAKGIVACFDLSTPERKLVWSFQVGPRAVTGIRARQRPVYIGREGHMRMDTAAALNNLEMYINLASC
jgi:hypothetical protein